MPCGHSGGMLPSNSPSASEERRVWLRGIRADLATAERSALTLLENDLAAVSAQILIERLAVIRAEVDLLEHIAVPSYPRRRFRPPAEGPRRQQIRP